MKKRGARVPEPVGTEKEALDLIEHRHFDAVLFDANLHGRSVDAIAAMLNRRNIPFLFVTGYGKEGLPEAFKQTIALPKPFSEHQLIDAVVKLNFPQTNSSSTQALSVRSSIPQPGSRLRHNQTKRSMRRARSSAANAGSRS